MRVIDMVLFECMPAICVAASMAAAAQSPFVGEWRLDPLRSRIPDEMRVQ